MADSPTKDQATGRPTRHDATRKRRPHTQHRPVNAARTNAETSRRSPAIETSLTGVAASPPSRRMETTSLIGVSAPRRSRKMETTRQGVADSRRSLTMGTNVVDVIAWRRSRRKETTSLVAPDADPRRRLTNDTGRHRVRPRTAAVDSRRTSRHRNTHERHRNAAHRNRNQHSATRRQPTPDNAHRNPQPYSTQQPTDEPGRLRASHAQCARPCAHR